MYLRGIVHPQLWFWNPELLRGAGPRTWPQPAIVWFNRTSAGCSVRRGPGSGTDSLDFFFLLFNCILKHIYLLLRMCARATVHHVGAREQLSGVSLSIMWVLGTEFRLSGLVAGIVTPLSQLVGPAPDRFLFHSCKVWLCSQLFDVPETIGHPQCHPHLSPSMFLSHQLPQPVTWMRAGPNEHRKQS